MSYIDTYLKYISVSYDIFDRFINNFPKYSTDFIFDGSKFWKELKSNFIDPLQYIESNNDILYFNYTDKYYSKTNDKEYERFNRALQINEKAAYSSVIFTKYLLSCNHYKACGFISAKEMFNNLYQNEENQFIAFIRYLKYYNFHKLLKNNKLNIKQYLK